MGICHWMNRICPMELCKKTRNIIWGGRMCHEEPFDVKYWCIGNMAQMVNVIAPIMTEKEGC